MTKHILFALALLATGCSTTGTVPADPNDLVVLASEAATRDVFTAEQPKLNAAIASLPPESQAMVQQAYQAVQVAIAQAEVKGVQSLPAEDHAKALKAIADLTQLVDVMHATLHDGTARASNPNG